MSINEATIKRVLYYPEQLPDSAMPAIAVSSEVSPPLLDLRQFPPLLVRLSEVAVDRDDDVEMRFKVDTTNLSVLTGSMSEGRVEAQTVVLTGNTTTGGAATELTIANIPPLSAILSARALITNTDGVATQTDKALTVVADTPDADGEIQLTAINKFKLFLTTALKAADILLLRILPVGDLVKNNFSLLAKSRIYYNLFDSSAVTAKTDFKTFFSLWVIKPTVAHKLRLGIPLTPEEQKLNRDLGISDTVEKGLLPLPLSQQIAREYQVIQEETHGFNVTVPTAGVDVETLHPINGQFLVLTKLSADPGDASTDNIRIAIDRDQVSDYIEFPTYALGATAAVSLGKEISCFIPALSELRIKLKATVSKTINIRFTVQKCALTNIFRARWGLATRGELPGDVYDKVAAGVL